jgi:hypothetical protein
MQPIRRSDVTPDRANLTQITSGKSSLQKITKDTKFGMRPYFHDQTACDQQASTSDVAGFSLLEFFVPP